MIRALFAALALLVAFPAFASPIERRWGDEMDAGRVTLEFDSQRVFQSGRVWHRWTVRQDLPVPCMAVGEVLAMRTVAADLMHAATWQHEIDGRSGTLFWLTEPTLDYGEGWFAVGPTACLAVLVVYVGEGT